MLIGSVSEHCVAAAPLPRPRLGAVPAGLGRQRPVDRPVAAPPDARSRSVDDLIRVPDRRRLASPERGAPVMADPPGEPGRHPPQDRPDDGARPRLWRVEASPPDKDGAVTVAGQVDVSPGSGGGGEAADHDITEVKGGSRPPLLPCSPSGPAPSAGGRPRSSGTVARDAEDRCGSSTDHSFQRSASPMSGGPLDGRGRSARRQNDHRRRPKVFRGGPGRTRDRPLDAFLWLSCDKRRQPPCAPRQRGRTGSWSPRIWCARWRRRSSLAYGYWHKAVGCEIHGAPSGRSPQSWPRLRRSAQRGKTADGAPDAVETEPGSNRSTRVHGGR